MPGNPLVTVGIPFFNGAATLGGAIRSVLAQTLPDLELILLDDGSTDGALRVAESFDDARIRIHSDGRNLGLVDRLNQLPGMAQGRYLARMDADDVCHPDRLAREVDWIETHPETQVVATGAWVVDEHDRVVGSRHLFPLPDAPAAVIGHGFLLHPTVLARTVWCAANPYDADYLRAEDKELWARTWKPGTFHRVAEPLLFYRETNVLRPGPYRAGCRSDRRLIRRHGPALVGPVRTAMALARSLAVESVSLAAHHARVEGPLIRLRRQAIDVATSRTAEACLQQTIGE